MQKYGRALLYSVAIIIFLVGGCKQINPPEKIPAYLYIDKIQLNTSVEEGTNSNAIVDAWVFMNDNLVGVYELPAQVPVLGEGEQNIKIFGGIKNNGIGFTGIRYPFYQPYETRVDLNPKHIDTLHPTVTYYPDLNFWIEDFEEAGTKLVKDPLSDTSIISINDDGFVFEGNGTGKISMKMSDDFSRITTNEDFDFPSNPRNTFLEINYKGNHDMNIGVTGISQGASVSNYVLTVRSSDTWKKIYVDLTETLSRMSSSTDFEIYFDIINTNQNQIEFFLDNIKVIYP